MIKLESLRPYTKRSKMSLKEANLKEGSKEDSGPMGLILSRN